MRGNEYLTSNGLIAYPFADSSPGLDYGDGTVTGWPRLPVQVVVDASIATPGTSSVYLESASCSGTVYTFVVAGVELATTQGTMEANDYFVLAGTAEDGTYVRLLVNGPAAVAYFSGISTVSFGSTLPFLDHVIDRRPHILERLSINSGELSRSATGDVTLAGGYSVELDNANGVVTISAVPGSGLGKVPCQDQTIPSSVAPRGLVPVDGNIQLETGSEACYDLMPKPAAGIIQFAGTCEACCTCDDYVSILDELHRLVDQFSRIKDLLDEAREQYQTGVTTFNDRVLHQERFKATLTVGRDNATDNTRVRFILTLTNRDTVPCSVYGLTVAYEIPDGTCETVQDSLSFACRVPTDEPGEFMAVTGRDMDMASVATGWWAPYVWDGTRQLRSITAGNSIAITWEARVEHCVPHDAATWPLTGTVEVVVAFTATPPTGGVMVTKTIGYTCT